MRIKGKISTWNDDRGYGFISPLAGGGQTFVHIKAFANRARRPAVGDVVTYAVTTDARGRPCAAQVTIAGVPAATKSRAPRGVLSHVLALGFLLFVGGAVLLSAIPFPILPLYLIVSAATYAVYALDKMAADKGNWRTSESTLHLLALAGGWPGALIAQYQFRHKTRKQSFRAVFWATVVVNSAACVWLLTPAGGRAWRSLVNTFF